MKRVIVFIVASLCLAAGPINAQGTAQREKAEKLLTLMKMQENIEASFAAVKQMIPAQMEKMQQTMGQPGKPAPTPQQTEKMIDLISQELSWDKVKDDYVTLYAETFTPEELDGLIAFYKSPAGQAYIRKLPELTKRSMALTQGIMVKIMPKIHSLSKEMQNAPATPPAEQGK